MLIFNLIFLKKLEIIFNNFEDIEKPMIMNNNSILYALSKFENINLVKKRFYDKVLLKKNLLKPIYLLSLNISISIDLIFL